ncbi:MAG: regulatory iron-sulfur-containing complex subunit RicT [Thermodesulfobacteriota bacterium]
MENTEKTQKPTQPNPDLCFYRLRFRQDSQEFTGCGVIKNMKHGDVVMVSTDHGLEPATIICTAPACRDAETERKANLKLARRPSGEEINRYHNLPAKEQNGFSICLDLIAKHKLEMRLIRVERFFNGSKMIFYFTADNRVDFRALVKDLVLEFRTRVEMRQVGVRHETKMIGGLGTCGRELCCSSHIKNFDSVSIKMAKEQDLPLNPAKISGVCNRLLCCLTYEYSTYKQERKKMPRAGKRIRIGDQTVKIKRQHPLQQNLLVIDQAGEEKLLTKEEWKGFEYVKSERSAGKGKKQQRDNKGKRKKSSTNKPS